MKAKHTLLLLLFLFLVSSCIWSTSTPISYDTNSYDNNIIGTWSISEDNTDKEYILIEKTTNGTLKIIFYTPNSDGKWDRINGKKVIYPGKVASSVVFFSEIEKTKFMSIKDPDNNNKFITLMYNLTKSNELFLYPVKEDNKIFMDSNNKPKDFTSYKELQVFWKDILKNNFKSEIFYDYLERKPLLKDSKDNFEKEFIFSKITQEERIKSNNNEENGLLMLSKLIDIILGPDGKSESGTSNYRDKCGACGGTGRQWQFDSGSTSGHSENCYVCHGSGRSN